MLLVEHQQVIHELKAHKKDFKKLFEELLDEISEGDEERKSSIDKKNKRLVELAIFEFLNRQRLNPRYETKRSLIKKVYPVAEKILFEGR